MVLAKLGEPTHESIDGTGLKKMMSFKEWGVAYEIEKGHVTGWCVDHDGTMRYFQEFGEGTNAAP